MVLRGACGAKTKSIAESARHLTEEARTYMDGQDGRLIDYPRAWELFETAASLGSLEAKYNLAHFNRGGMGIPTCPNKFHRYLMEAHREVHSDHLSFAEAFYAPAEEIARLKSNIQNSLGVSFLEGSGVKKEVAQAARLFCEATEAGNLNSICNLSLALLQAVHEAKSALETLRNVCDIVERTRSSPPPNQVDPTDTSRSAPYVPLLAERMRKVELPVSVDDSFHAVHHLGVIGGDVMRLLAKESDDALGPHNLGVSYELGLTSPQPRLPDAVRSYKQAARSRTRKFVPAQYALARLYLNAARSGSVEVKRALKVYEEDSLITEGLKWLQCAAQSNFAKAQAFYAALYTEGVFGLKPDPKQAEHCLRKAIETGWPETAGIPTVDVLLEELPQFEPFLNDHLAASAHTAEKLLRHKSELEDRPLILGPVGNRVDYQIDSAAGKNSSNNLAPPPFATTVQSKVPSLTVPPMTKSKQDPFTCRFQPPATDLHSIAPTVRIETVKNPHNEAAHFYTARECQSLAETIRRDQSASTTNAHLTSTFLLNQAEAPAPIQLTVGHSPAWESGLRGVESEGQPVRVTDPPVRRRGMSTTAAMAIDDRKRLAHTRTNSAGRLTKIYTCTYSSDVSSTEEKKPVARVSRAGALLTASRLKHLGRVTDDAAADGEIDESTADGPRSVSASEVRGVTWDDLNNMPDSTVHQRWLEAYSMHESALRTCASGDDYQEWLPKLAQSYCLQSLAARREPQDVAAMIDRTLEKIQKHAVDKAVETQALFVWLNRYLHSMAVTEDEPGLTSESPITAPSDSLSRALSRLTEVVGLVSVDMTALEHSPIRLWNLLVLRAALKSRCFGYTKGALDDLNLALECCPESRKYEIHLAAIRATLLESGSGALPTETSVAFLEHLEGYVNLAPTHDRWPVNMSLEPIVGGMSERQRKQMAALVCKLEKRCVFQPPECKRPDVAWIFKSLS